MNPQAMIQYPRALDDAPNGAKQAVTYGSLILLGLSAIALILSGAGLYALMSFTVSQRTREIGVRTALGAGPRDIFLSIARRALFQLAAGTVLGIVLATWIVQQLVANPDDLRIDPAYILVVCAAFMSATGVLARLGPTLRGLKVKPVEALKEG